MTPKEHPILFSTPMVKAILEGRKSQTRRVVKDKELQENKDEDIDQEFMKLTTPRNKIEVGDVLWVRETFQERNDKAIQMGFDKYYYKADWNGCTEKGWKPSIFMPKVAARIWLKVVKVSIERLNEISKNDAIREGIVYEWDELTTRTYSSMNYATGKIEANFSANDSFRSLWDSINGAYEKNPYVWVYEFKQIKP